MFEKVVSVNDALDADLEPAIVILLVLMVIAFAVYWFANHRLKHINDDKPVQTRSAKILTKTLSPHQTHYYIVFEFNGGERLNLAIPVEESGVFVIGDTGTLIYQGSKYISFRRTETQQ